MLCLVHLNAITIISCDGAIHKSHPLISHKFKDFKNVGGIGICPHLAEF